MYIHTVTTAACDHGVMNEWQRNRLYLKIVASQEDSLSLFLHVCIVHISTTVIAFQSPFHDWGLLRVSPVISPCQCSYIEVVRWSKCVLWVTCRHKCTGRTHNNKPRHITASKWEFVSKQCQAYYCCRIPYTWYAPTSSFKWSTCSHAKWHQICPKTDQLLSQGYN